MDIKIRSADNPYILASLLLRLLPTSDTQKQSYALSVLKALAYNFDLVNQAPKLEGRSNKTMDFLKNTQIMKSFGKQIFNFFIGKKNEISWPEAMPEYTPVDYISPPLLAQLKEKDRIWIVPRVIDFQCERRTLRPVLLPVEGLSLTAQELNAFASYPLSCLGLNNFCALRGRGEKGLGPVDGQLPFLVKHHPSAKSHIAITSLERIQEDLKYYADKENVTRTPALKMFFESDVEIYMKNPQGPEVTQAYEFMENLLRALTDLQKRDTRYIFQGITYLLNYANDSDCMNRNYPEVELARRFGHTLGQFAGREGTFWFELLVGYSCCPIGSSELHTINPYLRDSSVVENLAAAILLTTNRLAQVNRSLAIARDVIKLLQQLRKMTVEEVSKG